MAKSDSVNDRRRYQRVLVEASAPTLRVSVEGFGPTLAFDMSYEGAAFAQPTGKKISEVDGMIEVSLETDVDSAVIPARVIRINEDRVAVHFVSINVDARVIIDRVVTDRIVGLNMTFIEPRHYSKDADFSHWFHGPKDTNLYLWWQEGSLKKAQMEMGTAVLVYDKDSLFFENKPGANPILNNQQIARKAAAIVKNMDINIEALMAFRKIIGEHVGAPV